MNLLEVILKYANVMRNHHVLGAGLLDETRKQVCRGILIAHTNIPITDNLVDAIMSCVDDKGILRDGDDYPFELSIRDGLITFQR